MAAYDGKDFEDTFEKIVTKTGCDCVRFYDTMYNYKKVKNACDFVISMGKDLPSVLVELKVCQKTSFPFNKLTQLEDLRKLKRFNSFVIIWFTEYQRIIALTISDVAALVDSGVKSFNPSKESPIEVIDLCPKFKIINPEILEFWKLWGLEEIPPVEEPEIF